jgi:hypothetical protein
MRRTGFVGASEARVLERIEPLAKLRQVMNGRLRIPATVTEISSPVFVNMGGIDLAYLLGANASHPCNTLSGSAQLWPQNLKGIAIRLMHRSSHRQD